MFHNVVACSGGCGRVMDGGDGGAWHCGCIRYNLDVIPMTCTICTKVMVKPKYVGKYGEHCSDECLEVAIHGVMGVEVVVRPKTQNDVSVMHMKAVLEKSVAEGKQVVIYRNEKITMDRVEYSDDRTRLFLYGKTSGGDTIQTEMSFN